MLFEAHLTLSGFQVFDRFDRSCLHHLTAVCNSLAFFTLRSAVSYFEATPLDEIRGDRSFLTSLTIHEHQEERRLLKQVANLNWSVRQKTQTMEPALSSFKPLGAFDKSWTFAEISAEPPTA